MKMVDRISASERSRIMAHIRGKDTAPELLVRKTVHSLGYRYQLGGYGLPGRPDIVFTARKKVIFVHGCFWHRHFECRDTSTPKSNVEFWENKFHKNVARDIGVVQKLSELGWEIEVIWECQLKDRVALAEKVCNFLGPRLCSR